MDEDDSDDQGWTVSDQKAPPPKDSKPFLERVRKWGSLALVVGVFLGYLLGLLWLTYKG